jgi:ankyrin repeat protein
MSALHWASDQDQLETVRLLLSHGADIEMIGADGMTPLHSAVTSGHLQMVKLLLEAGADVNAREGSLGKTPLMFAASHSFLAIVHLLLEQEADINVKDLNGSTALDWLRATKFSDSFEAIKEALEAHGIRS